MSDKISKAIRTLRLTGGTTYYAARAARRKPALKGICAYFSGEKDQDVLLAHVLDCLSGSGRTEVTSPSAAKEPGSLHGKSPITLVGEKKPGSTLLGRYAGAASAAVHSPKGRKALTGSRLVLTSGPLPEAFVPAPGQRVVSVFGIRMKEAEASVASFPFDGRQRTFFHSEMILAPDGETAKALSVVYGLRGIYKGSIVDASCVSAAELRESLLTDAGSLPSVLTYPTDRRRLLFYAGALPRNGITSSLKNLLRFLPEDTDAYLCTANVEENAARPDLTDLKLTGFIDLRDLPSMTVAEQPAALAYFVKNADTPRIREAVRSLYARELARVLPGIDFDAVIHFNGYGRSMMGLMGQMRGKKIIFVHNDLPREIDQKGRQHLPSLKEAYTTFDHIAVVSEALIEPTRALAGEGPDIRVVPNCHDFAGIRERARLPITPDPDTAVTLKGWKSIDAFLDGHTLNLITIGRFSAEKNHAMILEAFERFRETHPGAGLTVIGGYGDLYEETLARFTASPAAEDLCLIRSISNPMPILSRCDLFILASRYEGQPMVLAEAGCLGIPAIAAATRGSKEFMEKWDGSLIDCSVKGILDGMDLFLEGKIHPVRMDYNHYNEECIRAFLALVD